MRVKEGKGTGKIMLSPGVASECQACEKWLFPSVVYSTRWEVSRRRLLSSGVSGNCGGATWNRVLEGLAPMAPQKIPLVASQGDRDLCCRPRWGLREADIDRHMPGSDYACAQFMIFTTQTIFRDLVYCITRILIPVTATLRYLVIPSDNDLPCFVYFHLHHKWFEK